MKQECHSPAAEDGGGWSSEEEASAAMVPPPPRIASPPRVALVVPDLSSEPDIPQLDDEVASGQVSWAKEIKGFFAPVLSKLGEPKRGMTLNSACTGMWSEGRALQAVCF
jgi:hypothetical protein